MSDGAVIGSGTTDQQGLATIALSPPFTLGEVYGVRSEARTSGLTSFITPTLHWGQSQELSSCATLVPFDSALGLMADVGSRIFAVSLECEDADRVELGTSYSAFLVVGAPSQVVPCAGTCLLASTTWIETSLSFLTTGGTGFVSVDLPIPDDPALGGVQIAFQWWIVDGPAMRLSDIVAVVLRSQPFIPPGQEWFFGASADPSSRHRAQEVVPSTSPWSLTAARMLAKEWGAIEDPSLLARVRSQVGR
jgi:hypothetical protein